MLVLERLRLDGKVAIVTGAGRGLGQQMALALAEAGADVVCAARTEKQIEATAEAIHAMGRRAIVVPTDVRDSSKCDALIQACLDEFGQIDIMLSNAGIGDARGMDREFWDVTDEDWRDTIDVNLSSAFYCARAASKPMIEQAKGGIIINVASGEGLRGSPNRFPYGAAKAGLVAFTKSLAVILQRYDIRANCIIPDYVVQQPDQNEGADAYVKARVGYFPMQRLGEAWELGPLAVYLASDASSYVTGQGFIIDGGGLAGGAAPVGFAPEVNG